MTPVVGCEETLRPNFWFGDSRDAPAHCRTYWFRIRRARRGVSRGHDLVCCANGFRLGLLVIAPRILMTRCQHFLRTSPCAHRREVLTNQRIDHSSVSALSTERLDGERVSCDEGARQVQKVARDADVNKVLGGNGGNSTRPRGLWASMRHPCSHPSCWSFAADTHESCIRQSFISSVMCRLRTAGILDFFGRLLPFPRVSSHLFRDASPQEPRSFGRCRIPRCWFDSGFTFLRQFIAHLDEISFFFLRESGLWDTSLLQRVTSSSSIWSS